MIEEFIPLQQLQDNADFTDKETINVPFSEDRMAELRLEQSDYVGFLQKREYVKKVVSDLMKNKNIEDESIIQGRLKDLSTETGFGGIPSPVLKSKIAELAVCIRNGYEDVTMAVYGIADYEENKMHIYSEDGQFRYSRSLRPNEKQLSMKTLKLG